jgi:hypothetical protein
MIVDKSLEFSDAQGAITSTTISTNVIDLGATPALRDIGHSERVWFVVQVDVTGTGTGTVTIELVSDSTENLATSPTIHYTSPAIVGTDLVAGAEIIRTPITAFGMVSGAAPGLGFERYLGVQYTISGTVGAVKLSAFFAGSPQMGMPYETNRG